MNFEYLIGQHFYERDLYELLLFELESNFSILGELQLHIYFDRVDGGKVAVTEIRTFKDDHEMDTYSRSIIERKEWYEIGKIGNHYDLVLIRLDRTGWLSAIFKDKTRTHEWAEGWADEGPPMPPLTEEEIRLGFLELMGLLDDPPLNSSSVVVK